MKWIKHITVCTAFTALVAIGTFLYMDKINTRAEDVWQPLEVEPLPTRDPRIELGYALPYVEPTPEPVYNIEEIPIEKIRCTCYIDTGITKSGTYTREGICGVGSNYHDKLGMTAILYDIELDGSLGGLIGYYEVMDTGGGLDITGDGNGDNIDIWQPSMEKAKEWAIEHGDYLFIQWVDAKG